MDAAEFDSCTLYAGLAGVEIDFNDVLPLARGISLRRIYAHVMTPMLMAFKKPIHKSFWAAVSDGRPHDIYMELTLPNECGKTFEEKIDLAKTVLALLRFHASPHFAFPIVSNVPIEEDAARSKKHHFVAIEPLPPFFSISSDIRKTLSNKHFEWTTEHLQSAIDLKKSNEQFAFALAALNSWQTIRSGPLALVFIWAALENIFSPDKAQELRFRVSTLIASFLEGPGEGRKQKFAEVLRLYDARSKAAHGSSKHDDRALYDTYDLLREVIMKMLRKKRVPTKSDLESNLFGQ